MNSMRLLLSVLTLLLPSLVLAAEPAPVNEPLVIGTRVAPPFVIETDSGGVTGISIELWETLAAELGSDYEFRRVDLGALVSGLESGELDASVAALTVTPGREARIDFTHPFHTTGLAIAVQSRGSAVGAVLANVFSWQFLVALSGLGALLLGVGVVLWLVERKRNPGMFGGTTLEGIGSSFWWAAVTMTTVGYGDKAPVTLAGRIVGLVWMFAAIILISGFTAAIATSLTVSQLSSSVNGPADLSGVRVATVSNSSSSDYLEERGVSHEAVADLDVALSLLAADQVDAVVYDAPILRYLSNQSYNRSTRVLSGTFRRQDYAIALPAGSELREPLNRLILERIADPDWQTTLNRYLGAE